MTPAKTGAASNVFTGVLLRYSSHYTVVAKVAGAVPYLEACELLEYAI